MRSDHPRRFRFLAGALAVLGAVLLCSCGEPSRPAQTESTPQTPEEARQAVIDAHRALIAAYEAGDLEAFLGLLDPSEELLIFHPLGESRIDGIEGARIGLPRMFEKMGKTEWSIAHPSVNVHGDTAWVTSHVLITGGNLEAPFVGRSTEIWVRRGQDWRLIHGHWSPTPAG